MGSRLKLHETLKAITDNVYFQPPESIKMEYPCIRYSRERITNKYANDNIYLQSYSYKIVVIDRSPVSKIVEQVSKLPQCQHTTSYTSNGLNHDIFTIHY